MRKHSLDRGSSLIEVTWALQLVATGFSGGTPVSSPKRLSSERKDVNQVRWAFQAFPTEKYRHLGFSHQVRGLRQTVAMGARVLAMFQVAEAGDGYISGKMSENISYFSF